MKILFFINKLYGGGAERVSSILMNHLCENHETTAVVFDDKEKSYQINSSISVHKISVNNTSRIVRFINRIRKIRKEIKKNTPDIIISFLTPINIYVLIASLFLKKRIIISERSTLNRTKSRFVRLIRKLIYPMANRIVFVTKTDCQNFWLPQKSLTIYNPAIFEPFNNYENRQKTIITIASNGRWHIKGLDLLIKAWAIIAQQNPEWALEICGKIRNTQLPDGITLQNQERVRWIGWTDNITETLQIKSIFVLASRFEGCPNSLIEAMSQGCACVVTDCDCGPKEIITNDVDGLIAKSENVDDIAAKLQMLIDDENMRRRLSAKAIEKAKLFDKHIFYAKWDNLISETATE
ncbi:MAG: glycosyltransferase [Salinivirgaceae bacterium]|nr:glycosyltransferase [Salinivirgaceae bacterium]